MKRILIILTILLSETALFSQSSSYHFKRGQEYDNIGWYESAMEEYKIGAAAGEMESQIALYSCYMDDIHCPKNLENRKKALSVLQKYYKSNIALCLALALEYCPNDCPISNNDGTPNLCKKDINKSIEYWKIANKMCNGDLDKDLNYCMLMAYKYKKEGKDDKMYDYLVAYDFLTSDSYAFIEKFKKQQNDSKYVQAFQRKIDKTKSLEELFNLICSACAHSGYSCSFDKFLEGENYFGDYYRDKKDFLASDIKYYGSLIDDPKEDVYNKQILYSYKARHFAGTDEEKVQQLLTLTDRELAGYLLEQSLDTLSPAAINELCDKFDDKDKIYSCVRNSFCSWPNEFKRDFLTNLNDIKFKEELQGVYLSVLQGRFEGLKSCFLREIYNLSDAKRCSNVIQSLCDSLAVIAGMEIIDNEKASSMINDKEVSERVILVNEGVEAIDSRSSTRISDFIGRWPGYFQGMMEYALGEAQNLEAVNAAKSLTVKSTKKDIDQILLMPMDAKTKNDITNFSRRYVLKTRDEMFKDGPDTYSLPQVVKEAENIRNGMAINHIIVDYNFRNALGLSYVRTKRYFGYYVNGSVGLTGFGIAPTGTGTVEDITGERKIEQYSGSVGIAVGRNFFFKLGVGYIYQKNYYLNQGAVIHVPDQNISSAMFTTGIGFRIGPVSLGVDGDFFKPAPDGPFWQIRAGVGFNFRTKK